jgi:hypothetical protein
VGSALACVDSVLRIPGGSAPGFGPAPINPGPRPPCGNPGNPAACPAPPPPCTTACQPPPPGVTLKDQLNALLAADANALAKLKLGGLVKRGRKVSFTAPGAGTLAVKLARKSTVLASGKHVYTAAGKGTVSLKLGKQGKKALRRALGEAHADGVVHVQGRDGDDRQPLVHPETLVRLATASPRSLTPCCARRRRSG